MHLIQYCFGGFVMLLVAFSVVFRIYDESAIFLTISELLPGEDNATRKQVFAVILSSTLLVAYSTAVLRIINNQFPEYRHREDDGQRAEQAFDTIYYLGFVGTLVAMVVGLTQPPSSTETARIVSQNAIALVTTVFGITIRTGLVLSIGSETEEDPDTLALNRQKLERQMQSTEQQIALLGNSSNELAQTLKSVVVRINEIKDFDSAYSEIMENIIYHANEAIESRILYENENFRKSIKVLAEDSLKARNEISASIDEIAKEISRLSEAASQIRNNSTNPVSVNTINPVSVSVSSLDNYRFACDRNSRPISNKTTRDFDE